MALTAAIKCTILASAGPQRSRMLAVLYKDERSAELPEGPFLEKVYLERILQKEEVRPKDSALERVLQIEVMPTAATGRLPALQPRITLTRLPDGGPRLPARPPVLQPAPKWRPTCCSVTCPRPCARRWRSLHRRWRRTSWPHWPTAQQCWSARSVSTTWRLPRSCTTT